MQYEIRQAGCKDAEGIASVHYRAWKETYSNVLEKSHWESDTLENRILRWNDLLSSESFKDKVVVSVFEGAICGFATSGEGRNKSGLNKLDVVELKSLYVLKEYQRNGIGTQLLGNAIPSTDPAYLWVAKTNISAINFYRKHSFILDGTRFLDSLGLIEVRMVRL